VRAPRKTPKQLDAEIAAALDDDDPPPTAEEIATAVSKVQGLIDYLRLNATGWEEEGDQAEARKFRKRADQIATALLAHDLTQLRKLTSSAPLLASEQLSDRDLDPLSFGWGRR
jgi:hypothetical protein